ALRRAIVTAQIAFTLILVIAAGLFVRTLSGLLVKGPGFDTSSLISFGIKPALNGYSGAEESRLIRRITEGLRDSSSIQASAVAHDQLLLGGAWSNSLTIQADERYITDREVQMNAVSPGFFATLGARIVAGRDFNEHDALNVIAPNQSMPVSQTRQRAVIVNEAFVKRYFGGRNPLGARVAMGSAPDAKPDSEIVGVVENISYRNVREQWEQAYFPIGTELWLEFLRQVSGNARVSLSIDSGDPSQRRSRIANRLFPHAGRANRPILEHRAYAGRTFQQLRHPGAPALAGWPVRRDVFRGDPTHARDRYSIGAGGDTPFYRLAGTRRCAGDDRRGNSDRAAMRLGVGPSC